MGGQGRNLGGGMERPHRDPVELQGNNGHQQRRELTALPPSHRRFGG
jgi:hypothetical protein